MCFPAVGMILGVAQAAVSFMGAQANYEAQADRWKQNYVNALAAGRDEQKQLTLRMTQEGDAHSQKSHLTNIEQAKVTAEAVTSAATSGVSGISVDNIILGIRRDIDTKRVADNTNYKNKVIQLTSEMDATTTRTQNRINSVARPTSPNPLGFALQGIGGALKAA